MKLSMEDHVTFIVIHYTLPESVSSIILLHHARRIWALCPPVINCKESTIRERGKGNILHIWLICICLLKYKVILSHICHLYSSMTPCQTVEGRWLIIFYGTPPFLCVLHMRGALTFDVSNILVGWFSLVSKTFDHRDVFCFISKNEFWVNSGLTMTPRSASHLHCSYMMQRCYKQKWRCPLFTWFVVEVSKHAL